MQNIGFDNEKYLKEQSDAIIERAKQFDNKLYLEFGGKLAYDYHAARILPGFDPNVKLRLLQILRDKIDIIICIYSGDIERKKMRADFGISYDADTLRIIDNLREWNLDVKAVVITRYNDQPAVKAFMNKLTRRGVNVYAHRAIQGYPADVDIIVSENGYGANSYIKSEKPIVVVTGPGPASGKMATCLSQVYHDHLLGINAGYAKFETFPVWNLPLKHPVNIAYEAATADIADVNMVDPFHYDAHSEIAINYNRDIEVFPVVKRICDRIMSAEKAYLSPTEMGVNKVGFAISNDEIVKAAAKQEIIRRYFRYRCEYAMGLCEKSTVDRVKVLMDNLQITEIDRIPVLPARKAAEIAGQNAAIDDNQIFCGAAIRLPNGEIITGKNSQLLHASASCILKAIRHLAGLPDTLLLISSEIIDSVGLLKKDILCSKRISLDVAETLIALSVSCPNNSAAKSAMNQLSYLNNCEMHLTHLPTPGDEAGLRKLGINLTSDPNFASPDLFVD